ncbi:Cloroperoxidase [Dissoconium aciculare CBS 342.82]|uniref:Cloroperoxidase n=1 Tax=Dissoconium aciculare CBS 342.82 TaxID=1314786 RepID=A0A6J3LSM3_9PEZI|nr:Cloroperoxidase [Dissoconium aciculare CBS 342.82]KAF1818800.1 Cloroperoxidase [Dissoconium aciculare CBS 342.82]
MFNKLSTTAVLLSSSSLLVSAFPHIAQLVAEQQKRQIGLPAVPFPEWPGLPTHALYNKFDAAAQHVSVSGKHEYRAPGPGDIRGPCAGLNAAANHGYIPRDGIATAEAINTGLWEAFGLDASATLVLQAATMFFDGDPLSGRWSIGYHSDKTNSLGLVGDILGNQTGICAYGHLKTEGDASITRGDWLAPTQNSNCASYPEFAQELLDLAKVRTGGNITPQVLAEHSHNRKQHSIATNPNYFSPAYAGVAFTFGAHMFAFELLANHSTADPRGVLTPAVFEAFFGYTRDADNKLVFTYGTERIPENWYRRAHDDAWTLADIGISTAQQCASYPSNCQVGGNTGTVNSFAGVDAGDITGGLLNSFEDLTDPDRLLCFMAQAIQADVPSFLDNVFNGVILQSVLELIPTVLVPALKPLMLTCPNLPPGKSVTSYGSNYPGVKAKLSGQRNPYK